MKIQDYLNRIKYPGKHDVSLEALTSLHRQHLLTVPFENLDIPLDRPIELSFENMYRKIVGENRGGFCYELNGLFYWLLREMGYSVKMLSGQVIHDGKAGPEFDHMLILVELDNLYLADVGFGDSYIEPLPLDFKEYWQRGVGYRIIEEGTNFYMEEKRAEKGWVRSLLFTLQERELEEFSATCNYQQTENPTFTETNKCSIATETGRTTFWNHQLTVRENGEKQKYAIQSEKELRALLLKHFSVDLPLEQYPNALLRPISSS